MEIQATASRHCRHWYANQNFPCRDGKPFDMNTLPSAALLSLMNGKVSSQSTSLSIRCCHKAADGLLPAFVQMCAANSCLCQTLEYAKWPHGLTWLVTEQTVSTTSAVFEDNAGDTSRPLIRVRAASHCYCFYPF